MDSAILPNFFLLGAAKAGTTSLYDLLRQHPELYLSFDKEPMFFSRDDYFARGVDWYSRTFFADGGRFPMRGEATPHYLYWAEKVFPRIKQVYGAKPVRFIVILREPVQRAHAWYWNMIREGQETLPFIEALKAEEDRIRQDWAELEFYGSMRYGYYRGGRYASQIRAYLNDFPSEHFHILLLEDLQTDPAGALRKICTFLGIRADFEFNSIQSNAAVTPRHRGLHQLIRGPSRGKDLGKHLIPFPIWHRMKLFLLRINQREFEYPAIGVEAEQYLKSRYASERSDLSALIGRDLSHWS